MHSGWRVLHLPAAQGTQCSAVHWRSLGWSGQLEHEAFSWLISPPFVQDFTTDPVFPPELSQ